MKMIGLTINELFKAGYERYASHAKKNSEEILSAPDLLQQDPDHIEAMLIDSRYEAALKAVAEMISLNNAEITKQLNELGYSMDSNSQKTQH
ncbi:hypothetical protein J25TS5_15210 [Paenibacillus faecis]|uniref:hypothetical protein n=1 Tax=Paenibacillus faecis TaxID=862114 RepID=UPI001B1BF25C|nr:hypothetical protein [Paenibacillus faecis]GIO84589.1 hypothetical protein J25TS5_15210 [Paenibacillus faecis]